jgi:hypothetical protein
MIAILASPLSTNPFYGYNDDVWDTLLSDMHKAMRQWYTVPKPETKHMPTRWKSPPLIAQLCMIYREYL